MTVFLVCVCVLSLSGKAAGSMDGSRVSGGEDPHLPERRVSRAPAIYMYIAHCMI